jgi:lipopolysaccharide/colanic/teichoic acid biosynthesis glycosyltransferase
MAARGYELCKRVLDVTLATVLLVVFSPLLLLVAVLVRATSPGPVLFRQTRVGRAGAPFRMLKFRTMLHGCDDGAHRDYVRRLLAAQAEAHEGLYKLVDDPRVTRIGAVLRRLSIDELPQLLNVLKGDMTLVGPRPALPFEAELFPDWAAPRYLVAPGLTGLWQVSGRNRLTMLQGLELDVAYVEQRSLVGDMVILLRTVPAVLGHGGR